jgi:hypothetical protein
MSRRDMQEKKAMSKQEQHDLTEQVHRLDFAAAVRREQEQIALRQGVQAMPLWLFAVIWTAIGAILFGGGLFVGWLEWHR